MRIFSMQIFSNYFKCIISKTIIPPKNKPNDNILKRQISKGEIEDIFKESAHRNTMI